VAVVVKQFLEARIDVRTIKPEENFAEFSYLIEPGLSLMR
jgi:hypothetical protein